MAQLLGAGDDRRAVREAAEQRDQRQLVDRERHLPGADRGSPASGAVPGDDRPSAARRRRAARSSTSIAAPIRFRIPSRPIAGRVQSRRPRARTSLPRTSVAATMKNAAEEKSPGTRIRPQLEAARPGATVTRRRRQPPWTSPGCRAARGRHRGAGSAQHALGVVAGRARLDHAGRPVGEEARRAARTTSPARWPPAAGTRCRAARAPAQRAAAAAARRGTRPRRPSAAAARRRGPPGGGGSTRRRRASTAPPAARPASPGSRRSSVPALPTSIARAGAGAAQARPRVTVSVATPSAALELARPRPRAAGPPRASQLGVGRRRGSPRPPGLALGHRADQRRAVARSTCRAAGASVAAQRPRGSKRVIRVMPRRPPRPTWPRPRTISAARSASAVAGDPERDRAGAHVGRRVERHVLDVDPRAGRAPARSRPRSRAGSRPRAAARAARRRRAPPRAAAGGPRAAAPCQRRDRLARHRSGSARRPRAGARRSASISRATASRLVAKMSPQIAGFAPATRVVSRKLGPTSGRRSDSSAARRGGLADEHVGEHVREVADRRHQPVVGLGVDRLRPRAQVGDRPLQAVVDGRRSSARSASGTSARPRTGRRARSRPRRSRRRPADGRR